jgi:hypothetical protein
MCDSRDDELDVLLARTLRAWAADEAPSDRVWSNIKFGLRERERRGAAPSSRLRRWWTEALALGTDVVMSARIILTPTMNGGDREWTRRLVVVGQSAVSLHLSIHR